MSQVFPQPRSGLPDLVTLYPLVRPHFDKSVRSWETSTHLEEELFENLITEDEEPVDNLFSAKQQRLLVEPLYSSWTCGTPFLADANVGVFHTPNTPPLVPDMFLSLQVRVPEDWWQKRHRSYFVSEFGKPPEVVIEIVSNREGEEDGSKLLDYARMGVRYYIIFDPLEELKEGVLRVYELQRGAYVKKNTRWLAKVGLGVTLWTGFFEEKQEVWLRWCDREGNLIPTGKEDAAVAKEESQQAKEQAQQAKEQAQQAKEQAQQAKEQAQQAKEQAQQAEFRAQQAEFRAQQAESALEQERLQAQQTAAALEQERLQTQRAAAALEQERLQKERLMAQLQALGLAHLLD